MLIRTDTTNCANLTEKELSQHCAIVSCEHRNSTRSHDCRLFQSDCRIPNSFQLKFSTAGLKRDSFTISRDFTGFVQCTFQTCVRRCPSLVVMRLNNSGCLMSNRWDAFSVRQLSPNVNSLDTARLQISTVFVLSPSAAAFESFMECFLAALCHHHPC